jgi:predicted transposase YbfD/YdcC
MPGFAECFEDLQDPRTGNAERHDLLEILMIALCTVLCGGESAVDMADFARAKEGFLREFLKLDHGMPSHDTFSRIFRLLDPEQFRACFQRFMARFAGACEGVIAVDGKVLRRSFDKASGKSPLHMVSAWGCDQRLVLGQIATDAKSNEITAVPKLLAMLSLKDATVTVDALNTQRDIARQIIDQGGDYAMALKANQPTLHADVTLFFDDPKADGVTTHTEVDADHGRIETRTCSVSTEIEFLKELHDWPGLAAIGKVVRTRVPKLVTGTVIPATPDPETAYYLFSQPVSAERAAHVVRAHWGVENRLHWVLDVAMNEDQARNRMDNGPENLAVLRHLALNVIRKDATKISVRRKIKRAAWTDSFLRSLLAQF